MKDLVFIDQDIEELKKTLNSSNKAVYRRLIDHCESYFPQELPSEHPASSTTFMGIAVANLSLAFLLSGEDRYKLEALRWINTIVSYPHWGNAHLVDVDLSAAWILFGLGLSYDWLKDTISEDLRKTIREKILLQGRRMHTFKVETEGSGWSTNYWQNHNWINMCGLAAAGYALRAEVPQVQEWIDSAKDNFSFVYSALPDDGSDYEGVVYWRYGAMWLFVYAHLLKEREGIDYFRSCNFLKNTFYYRLYQAAPNLEEQINYGDAHDRRSGHSTAIYYKVAAEYRNGHAQKMGNLVRDEFLESEAKLSLVKPGILPECFFEMLFYDDTVPEEDFGNLPLTVCFDDLGLFVNRSSWERDATLFSIKCSPPGGKKQWDLLWKLKKETGYDCFGLSHQHPDNNSFLIHSAGEFIAIDDGYNRNARASDHNVVLVDGSGYEGEGDYDIWKDYSPDMFGKMEVCEINENFSHFAGETSATYRKDLKLKLFRRHLVHTGRNWYFILDELDSENEHIYTWLMHSDNFPQVESDRFRYRTGKGQTDLYHYSDAPCSHSLDEHTVRAVMTTQEPDKFTETHMKTIRISNDRPVRKLSFISIFITGDNTSSDIHVSKIETQGAYGVEISSDGESQTLLYSKDLNSSYENIALDNPLTLIKRNVTGKTEVFGLQTEISTEGILE